jgi:NAD(P)-dependent dehydrogenase (short-subunit alcohol dehydrogenase family)
VSVQPDPSPWLSWQGRALVVGHGGIGQALVRQLAERAPNLEVLATSRDAGISAVRQGNTTASLLPLDLSSDASLAALGERLSGGPPLRIVINTAGLLHDGELQPEKRLSQVQRIHLERHFGVNGFGPLLLAQTLEPLLPRDQPCHFASLSARVGSIGDNRLGGWYSYRAAKAAQNQLLRCLAIEWARRLPQACVSLLHPGTTATPLSAPFQGSVPPERLFTPDRAARQLLAVLQGLGPAQTGLFWAWDGQPIPW